MYIYMLAIIVLAIKAILASRSFNWRCKVVDGL